MWKSMDIRGKDNIFNERLSFKHYFGTWNFADKVALSDALLPAKMAFS